LVTITYQSSTFFMKNSPMITPDSKKMSVSLMNATIPVRLCKRWNPSCERKSAPMLE
jgi:hypothetical protein